MLGDTISITLDGVATTLNKINQDNYTSEYFVRSTAQEVRLRIRHAQENVTPGKPVMERHQVDLTQTIYDMALGNSVFQSYTVIRMPKGKDPAVARKLTQALQGMLTAATTDKVLGWES